MPEGPSGRNGGMSLGDYMRVLWRWKWVIVIVVCASTAGAYAYSWRQAPRYAATASLLYVEPVDPSDPLGGSYYSGETRDLAVENVLDLTDSTEIYDLAQQKSQTPLAGAFGVSASAREGTSGTSSTSGVVDVTATSGDPELAAAAANGYAAAIVQWRKDQQLKRIAAAEEAVQANMAVYTTPESRQSTDYVLLQERLQNLKLLETTAAGDFEQITQAVPPSEPYAPQPRQAAVMGFGVGLLIGVALAFILEPLTARVSSKQEAARALGLPVVGTLPEIDRRSLDGGLVVLKEPRGQMAEALRLLRSNLHYLNPDGHSSLLVTSAGAGEGKSTVVCNLGVTLTLAGKRVVVVDGDIRRPRVHEYFGIPNTTGLSDVLAGERPLIEAIQYVELRRAPRPAAGEPPGAAARPLGAAPAATAARTPVAAPRPTKKRGSTDESGRQVVVEPALYVLTAGPQVQDPGELIASSRFGNVMRQLKSNGADLVLVDSPALLEVGDAAALAEQIDALVVVIDIKSAHHSALVEMRDLLRPLPCKQLGTVLVKAKTHSSGYGQYYSS